MSGQPAPRPGQFRVRYAVVSLLVLIPVFWQSRIQAGDLSSHIYNAWLAQLVKAGQAPGVTVVWQNNNVLFDLMLDAFYRIGGPGFAQRAAVSISVLVFVWGAFRFAAVVSGNRPWYLLPCIAALAYGWVYHMGFFNFHLSMGLSLWSLSLAWEGGWRRRALASLLLGPAYLAHALPVGWAAGLLCYRVLAERLSVRARAYLIAAIVIGMEVLHLILARITFTRWSILQLRNTTGADQLWVFDGKYNLALFALAAVWLLLLGSQVRVRGFRAVTGGIVFDAFLLTAACILILPTSVFISGYHHALTFVSERMSLAAGVCICALAAAHTPSRLLRLAPIPVAVYFFVMIYRDERTLNRIEDRMQAVVKSVEPGERIVGGIDDPDLHVFAITHMIDRVCLGRCFSYANYEPSTAAFRVRAQAENPIVVSDYQDCWRMHMGQYVVKDRDLPLRQLVIAPDGGMELRRLESGMHCERTTMNALNRPSTVVVQYGASVNGG